MDARRSTWEAAIGLAITWSLLAASTAVILQALGVLSQTAIVLGVIVIGFTVSWIRTGKLLQPTPIRCVATRPADRIARVPVSRRRVIQY